MSNIEKLSTHIVKTISMDYMVLDVNGLCNSEIHLHRTKYDPGAVHILIQTKGAVSAAIRYAYTKEARTIKDDNTCQVYKIVSKYNTSWVLLGSYSGDPTESGLLDLLHNILKTNNDADNLFQHTSEGFIRLKPKNNSAFDDIYGFPVFGDYEININYRADTYLYCHGIRNKDIEVISLVNTITTWADRLKVEYSGSEYPLITSAEQFYLKRQENLMKFTHNSQFLDLLNKIDSVYMRGNHIDAFIETVVSAYQTSDMLYDIEQKKKKKKK